jgi:hypothetical protein
MVKNFARDCSKLAQDKSIPRRIVAVLKPEVVQHHINEELCTVFVVFPLFCPTPVSFSCFALCVKLHMVKSRYIMVSDGIF